MRRQNKIALGLIFLVAIILISIGLFFYCSDGSCANDNKEATASSEENSIDNNEGVVEQAKQETEKKSREKRVPSSESDPNTTEDTPSNDDQNQY
ncbi:MAG: hypothetical protein WCK43_07360 [bacterium]